MPARISRATYADMYGPTTGDKVRLADTELFIEVENDFTTYGEEVKFGGGKVIRDGMGQGQLSADDVVDTLITNALVIDHWGIVKADVGLKDGRIAVIRVNVLTEQIDLAHALVHQRTCFGDDRIDIAREFRAACVWDHAECAEFIAAFLNGKER